MAPADIRGAGHTSADPGTGVNTPPTDTPASDPDHAQSWALGAKDIGGLLAVSIGVIALALIAVLLHAEASRGPDESLRAVIVLMPVRLAD